MVSYDDLPEDPLERRFEIDRRIETAIARTVRRRRIVVRATFAVVLVLVIALGGLVQHRLSHPEITAEDHLTAATTARRQGDLATAIRSLDAALTLDPSRLGARRLRAELALDVGDARGAREHLRLASPDGRGPVVILGLLRVDLLERRFDAVAAAAAAELARSPSEELEIVLAKAHVGAGRLEAAREVLDKLLSRLPTHADALHASAYLHLATGHLDAAAADQAALAARGESLAVHLLRGELALARADVSSARIAFSQAAALRPEHPEPRFGLARTALLARDGAGALNALAALSASPEPESIARLRAHAQALTAPRGAAADPMPQRPPAHAGAATGAPDAATSDGEWQGCGIVVVTCEQCLYVRECR